MSVSTSASPMTAEIEIFHPPRTDAGVRSRRAASPAKLKRMQSIPEEPVESVEPVEPEPEDDSPCGGTCALQSEVAPGVQQSEQVLEYVAKIREAIRLQGERLQEETIETRQQEEDKAEVGLDSKGNNTETKRESFLLVVSTGTKSALSGLRAKGVKQRESILLAASTRSKDALAGLKTVGGRMSTLLYFRRSRGPSQRSSQTVVKPVSPKILSHFLQAGEHIKQKENDSELETESLTDVEDGEEMALLPKGSTSTSSSSLSRSEREYKYQALQKSRFLRGVDTARGRVNHAKSAARHLLSVRRRPGGWSKLKSQAAEERQV